MAWPSVTLGTGNSAGVVAGSGTLTYSHTIGAGQTLLEVIVGVGNSSPATDQITGVTWNGVSLTRKSFSNDGSWDGLYVYELQNPSAATANVVVSYAFGGLNSEIASGSISFDGASTTIGTIYTGSGSNQTDPSITVIDSASGDLVVSAIMTDDAANATTQGGTLIFEAEDLNADVDFNAQYQTASGASTVCSWTHTQAGGGGNARVAFAVRQFTAALPTYANTPRMDEWLAVDDALGPYSWVRPGNWF